MHCGSCLLSVVVWCALLSTSGNEWGLITAGSLGSEWRNESVEASRHCWQGFGPRPPVAVEGKEGKAGRVLGAGFCLSVCLTVCSEENCSSHVIREIPGPCFQLECLESPGMFPLAGAVRADVLPALCRSTVASSGTSAGHCERSSSCWEQLPVAPTLAGMGGGSWLYARTWWR